MPAAANALLDCPDLLVVLPMLYVAWADGDLRDEELALIESKVEGLPFLSTKGRAALGPWLDPQQPPQAQDMAAVLRVLQSVARDLPADHRRTLVELGAAVAEHSDVSTPALGENEQRALAELEAVLGMDPAQVVSNLLEVSVPEIENDPVGITFSDEQAKVLLRWLDGPRHPYKQRVRRWLEQHPPFEHDLPSTRRREQVLERIRSLAEEGYADLAYPKVTTDAPDLLPFISVFETLALGDLSVLVKFGVQFGLYGGSLMFLGSERHRKVLPEVASLQRIGCFAMTESGHGSNVQGLRTVAQYDPKTQTFIVTTPDDGAHKEWIGNAACHAREAVVFCQLHVGGDAHGVHALIVPIRDEHGSPLEGVRIEDSGHKLGLNGVDNGRLWFDGVRVPRENLLDRYAKVGEDGRYASTIPSKSRRFFTTLGALVGGRVCVGTAAISAAKVGLSTAVHYSTRRRQFGPGSGAEIPIMRYRSQRLRLIPRIAGCYALSFAATELANRYAARTEADQREVESFAAGLKAYASEFCVDTLQVSRESCGGQGYASRNRFAALKADSDVFCTFEGDNTVLWQLVAKSRLTRFRRQFEEDRVFNMLRYLANSASTAVTERNPLRVRRTDPDHLRSDEFLCGAMLFREQDLVRSAAGRLSRRIKGGMDSFEAFLECQVHLIDLGRAHIERRIYSAFGVAIARSGFDEELTRHMHGLRALYGLWSIERDKGWFLENDYVESSKAKAIRKQVQILCDELAPVAVPLVNAFEIPQAWTADIALR